MTTEEISITGTGLIGIHKMSLGVFRAKIGNFWKIIKTLRCLAQKEGGHRQ
jgi:hypothetical protein